MKMISLFLVLGCIVGCQNGAEGERTSWHHQDEAESLGSGGRERDDGPGSGGNTGVGGTGGVIVTDISASD